MIRPPPRSPLLPYRPLLRSERTAAPGDRPSEPTEITLSFERGLPVALDGAPTSLPDLIRAVEAIAGRYGFGRVDMIENRRVGRSEEHTSELQSRQYLVCRLL